MSDAYTLIKSEDEKIKDFNKRILAACKDQYVIDGQVNIIDGQPVVTLMCMHADERDDESTDPLSIMVAKVSAVSEQAAEKSEQFLGKLYEIAEENIVDIQFADGYAFEWVTAHDLIHVTKAHYAHAEMVRSHHEWGKELQDDFDAKKYVPIKSQKEALSRPDTGLIKFNTAYAIVAYLVPSDDAAVDDQPLDADEKGINAEDMSSESEE